MTLNYWRLISLFLTGCLLGFVLGAYGTGKIFLNNLPASTEISIGKIKIRGNENIIKPEFKTEINESTEPKKTNSRRRIFKRKNK